MRCNPSYWLLGLIPIALLSWLAVQLEHEGIEADLGRRTQESLARKGLDWAVPIFAGRDGALTGKASDEAAPSRALAAIRQTWGVRITDNQARLIEQIDRYLWSASWRDGRVVLGGYVPTEDVRSQVATLASATFPKAEIRDEMTLARGVPDRAVWLSGIGFGLKQLAQLKRGNVEIETLALSISGEAPTPPVYKSVRSALNTSMPAGVKLASEKITPPVANPFVWSAKHTGSQMILGGYVPDEKLRAQFFAQTKALFPRLALVDRTEVAAGEPDGWSRAVSAALTHLASLKQGTADISARDMIFQGDAADEATAIAVRKALRLDVPQAFKLSEQIRYPKTERVAPGNYIMSVTADGTAIEVGGYVPSNAARAALIDLVKARYPGRPVTDKLQIQQGAPDGWQECIVAGLNALPRLKAGKALLNDRKLLVSGSTGDYAVFQGVPADVAIAAGKSCETATDIKFTGTINLDLTWRASRGADGTVALEGDIPDDASRPVLLDAAQRLFPVSRPIDRMKVQAAPMDPWTAVAVRGLEQLSRLKRGTAELTKRQLTVAGLADSEETARDVRAGLSKDLPNGFSSRDQIEVARRIEIIKEADRCQQMLRVAASGGSINFDRAKADLTSDSTSTLYSLADIANECPSFRIEIEGHTDDEGTDERNQRLSDRRAQAVVDFLVRAGVEANRLTAVGYGSTRPVADNTTAEGRARNRRIEFTVMAN